MTMWAIATGNSRLEGLGRLQTGMVARSIDSYFLLKDSNTNHPVDFVRNKARKATKSKKTDKSTRPAKRTKPMTQTKPMKPTIKSS